MLISIVFRRLALIVVAMLAFNNANAAERGAFSPSAPVRLDYELPESLPTGVSVTVPMQLSTPVKWGQLHFEVVSSEGLVVQSNIAVDFDLRQVEQPFDYDLIVVLGGDASRYLVVLVTVDGPTGSQSRSYRIDFSAETPATTPANDGLKLLPSSTPQ